MMRSRKPIARLWWLLLPSTGFFAYPEDTTLRERLRWGLPYLLWRAVNRLDFNPFAPVSLPVCRCDDCERMQELLTR